MDMQHFSDAYQFVCEYYEREHGWSPEKGLFRTRVEDAYQILEERAKTRRTISYEQLWTEIDSGRRYISPILDAIGYMEEAAGNPPLTVLVVEKPSPPEKTEYGDGYPSDGFEEQLEILGIRDRYPAITERKLVEQVKQEVFDHPR